MLPNLDLKVNLENNRSHGELVTGITADFITKSSKNNLFIKFF